MFKLCVKPKICALFLRRFPCVKWIDCVYEDLMDFFFFGLRDSYVDLLLLHFLKRRRSANILFARFNIDFITNQ